MSCDFKFARIVCRIPSAAELSYSAVFYDLHKTLQHNTLALETILNTLFRICKNAVFPAKTVNFGS